MTPLTWAGFAGVCVGAVLLGIALRGRRTDDRPACAACNHDLGRTPPRTGEHGPRCPKCGADLTEPDAMMEGHRAVSRRGVAAAAAVVAAGLALMATAAIDTYLRSPAAEQVTFTRQLNQLAAVDRATRDAALAALLNRLDDPAAQNTLLGHARTLMTHDTPLSPAELTLLQAMADRGVIDATAYGDFLFNRLSPSVAVATVIGAGSPLPVCITPGKAVAAVFDDATAASLPRLRVTGVRVDVPGADVAQVAHDVTSVSADAPTDAGGVAASAAGGRELTAPLDLLVPWTARDGAATPAPGERHQIRVVVVAVHDVAGRALQREYASWHAVEVLPPGVPWLQPVREAYAQRRAAQSLRVRATRWTEPDGVEWAQVSVELTDRLLEAIAGRASLHWAGQTCPLGIARLGPELPAGTRRSWRFRVPDGVGDGGDEAVLVIVPDEAVAARYIDTRRYLDLEMHLPVRVERP